MTTNGADIVIDILRGDDALRSIVPEWAELHRMTGALPHTAPEWILRCWRLTGRTGRRKLNVIAARLHGRLILVAPLMRARDITGRHTLSWIQSDTPFYCDLVVERSAAGERAIGAVADVLRAGREGYRLRLNSVRKGAAAESLLARLGAVRKSSGTARVIPLDRFENFDAFLGQLSANFRQHFRRMLRLLERRGPVQLELVKNPEEIAAALRWLLDQKLAKIGERSPRWLRSPDTYDFLRETVVAGLATGACSLYRLSVGGHPVAIDVAMRDDRTFYLSKCAYDPDWHSLSPGMVLAILLIREALAQGLSRFDLMGGNHQWKTRFPSVEVTMGNYRARLQQTALERLTAILPFRRSVPEV